MAKKNKAPKKDDDAALPKFGGFNALAGGLAGFKAQLDAEKKAEEAKARAAIEQGKAPPKPAARPQAPAPRPSKTNAAEDELTFHRMMAGVTPLDGGAPARVPVSGSEARSAERAKPAELQARARVEAEKALDHLHSIVDGVARFEVTDDGRRVEGRRSDVAPDLVRSLRRGMLPIDARLDLHGLTADAAREKLVEFLRAMRTRGERCVLVIHGKGDDVPGGGVLRGEIAAWLSQGKAKESVAAFATARDDDGGEGAVYVALRR